MFVEGVKKIEPIDKENNSIHIRDKPNKIKTREHWLPGALEIHDLQGDDVQTILLYDGFVKYYFRICGYNMIMSLFFKIFIF